MSARASHSPRRHPAGPTRGAVSLRAAPGGHQPGARPAPGRVDRARAGARGGSGARQPRARPDRPGAAAARATPASSRAAAATRTRSRYCAMRRSSSTWRSPSSPTGISVRRSCASAASIAWQLEIYEALACSIDTRLAAIAAKAVKETRYHHRFSSGWLVRLGDGTDREPPACAAGRSMTLWRFTGELFTPDEVESRDSAAGIAPPLDVAAAALVGAHR